MEQWKQGKVLENHHWNERLCSLRIEVELPKFKAGQFTRVALPDGEEMLARAYSLVNAPHEPVAEFYFNRVPGGPLSTRLHQLKAGDSVFLSRAVAGFLTLSEVPACKHLWMLATGTALGPFLSILKTEEPWDRFEKIILVHGVRSQDELTYRTFIDRLRQQHPDKFIPIASVTREQVSGTLHQRIPEAIRSGALEAQAGLAIDPESAHVMICGSPAMVDESTAALQEKGLRKHRRRTPGHISVEIYK
mgnify:CR=1 FL=1